MNKAIWTLNVDDYAPEITACTYPLIRRYADKIGAEFRVISERNFTGYPYMYEKLQMYELGREYDWNILIDSDALIHPEMFDITDQLTKDTVCFNGLDMAGIRWRGDDYFRRDGRYLGTCSWFSVASNWCLDLWHPLEDMSLQEALNNIFPNLSEVNSGLCPLTHFMDDYVISRNVARYGLKVTTCDEMFKRLGFPNTFLWHMYKIPRDEKLARIKEILTKWQLTETGDYAPLQEAVYQ